MLKHYIFRPLIHRSMMKNDFLETCHRQLIDNDHDFFFSVVRHDGEEKVISVISHLLFCIYDAREDVCLMGRYPSSFQEEEYSLQRSPSGPSAEKNKTKNDDWEVLAALLSCPFIDKKGWAKDEDCILLPGRRMQSSSLVISSSSCTTDDRRRTIMLLYFLLFSPLMRKE